MNSLDLHREPGMRHMPQHGERRGLQASRRSDRARATHRAAWPTPDARRMRTTRRFVTFITTYQINQRASRSLMDTCSSYGKSNSRTTRRTAHTAHKKVTSPHQRSTSHTVSLKINLHERVVLDA